MKVLLNALQELDEAVGELTKKLSPDVPLPRPRYFWFSPRVYWPWGEGKFKHIVTVHGKFRVPVNFTEERGKEEVVRFILQSGKVDVALKGIKDAVEWCRERARGRERASREILRQQERAIEILGGTDYRKLLEEALERLSDVTGKLEKGIFPRVPSPRAPEFYWVNKHNTVWDILENTGRQPAKVLKVLRTINTAIEWGEKRLRGMERASREILRQQNRAVKELNAEGIDVQNWGEFCEKILLEALDELALFVKKGKGSLVGLFRRFYFSPGVFWPDRERDPEHICVKDRGNYFFLLPKDREIVAHCILMDTKGYPARIVRTLKAIKEAVELSRAAACIEVLREGK